MSGLKIYGVAPTRTMRTLWMANELSLDYELVPISPRDGSTTSPEFLAVNPNASVPAIQDGDTTLWESLAINLYLAKKHGGDLAPRDDGEYGLALQWSFWAMGNVEGGRSARRGNGGGHGSWIGGAPGGSGRRLGRSGLSAW
jgi:glutathione S-transferase